MAGFEFDALFGPAYKGITLAAATAMALAQKGHNTPYAYNRKEAKDHGEGGTLVGAPLAGKRVVIVEEVISAGTSVRESVEMLRAAGATPVAVLIALDRMEKSGTADDVGEFSAVHMVEKDFGIPVFAIANLADLMTYLDTQSAPELTQYQDAVKLDVAGFALGAQFVQGALQVAAYSAANAAIAELDDLFVAFLDQQLVIDAFGPEFVFDDGNALTVVFGQHALEQSGFAGTQKPGKNGDRHHFVDFYCGIHL